MKKTQIPIIAIAIFGIAILLAQNNIDKAFADTVIYNVNGSTEGFFGNPDSNDFVIFAGEEFTTSSSEIGESFNKISISIRKANSPTGTLYVGVWNSTTTPTVGNYIKLFGTMDVTDLTTSQERYNFTSSAYEIQGNDIVGIFYNEADGSNRIGVYSSASNAFDGTNTIRSSYRVDLVSWSDSTGVDLDMALILTDASSSATVCVDTNLDGVSDLCFTDTNNDGVADNGLAGSLGAFQSNANVTQMGQQWFCSFNIGDACDNDDAETNGVGVFYLLILIIFSYAIVVSIHLMAIKASNNNVGGTQALMIHPILLLVMLFVDVALSWYLNFIPDTIFYSILVLMVGLGGFGIYRMVTKDN